MSRGSRLPTSQTSRYALSIGDATAPVANKRPRVDSVKDTPDNSPRPPPLPSDIALAYGVNDAAKVTGLSRSSIYNLIGEGRLRSVLVAGRRLIPADALHDLLGILETDLQKLAPAVPAPRREKRAHPLLNP
jgi:excisionase family DNA binding protein